jgi:hypothetical protein
MLIVSLAFAAVFLFRDAQVLTVQDQARPSIRFGIYAPLVVLGMILLVLLTGALSGWTDRRFALGAIAVQLVELMLAFAFRRSRLSWIGCILPSPAFLVALYAVSLEIHATLHAASAIAAVEIVTASWLLIVAGLTSVLCWMKNSGEDRAFVTDFAMMTSCTALIFLPFGLS